MPLTDLLYRCPNCGSSPLRPAGSGAGCPACGLRYLPGGAGGRIRVGSPNGNWGETPVATLVRQMEEWGGQGGEAEAPGGAAIERTRVLFSLAVREDPIRYRGRLLGFVERFGPGLEGVLTLDSAQLQILLPSNPDPQSWALEDLRSLQSSSSFIQFTDTLETVVLLHFPDDSPRRWDEVLRAAIQTRWSTLGRGIITEFQPRIRTQ